MSLLSRHARLVALMFLLFALSTLPMHFSAAPAWAGGSPDETLNPQRPPNRAIAVRPVSVQDDAIGTSDVASYRATRPTSRVVLSWRERFGIAFRIYLASMLRF